ncbi:MAG: hypothetical protein JXQ73_08280, partial [Phycisphaerae bacterium]|nr:hypothetical protein [Phycisphaerae bacterium]
MWIGRRMALMGGVFIVAAVVLGGSAPCIAEGQGGAPSVAMVLENDHFKATVCADGRLTTFVDKRSGKDFCQKAGGASLAWVRIDKKVVPCTAAAKKGDQLELRFGETGVVAAVKPVVRKRYVVFEVVSLDGKDVEEFAFIDVPIRRDDAPKDPFVACALALNLQTNVREIPQPATRLWATCHSRFGFVGARVAVIACPHGILRDVMKEVVTAAPDLPKSDVGGPWALDSPANKGSYLFNFGDMSEQTVDQWIELAQSLGINQIDFHGGGSFRFGDCRPNPKTYPKGFESLKAVIDRLHAAGIKAGLHTYAFFINKGCPWVTPVPDPRLGKDATFTLAAAMTDKGDTVPVVETTKDMSTITGFFVRNSVTLQIDDELITYTGVSKEAPYTFTGCARGACGTKPAAHAAGAKVHHLKECFGLFLPDGDSTLLVEVAAKAAEAYNTCGFDMIYLDALDGEDTLGGGENSWHYGSKFVF